MPISIKKFSFSICILILVSFNLHGQFTSDYPDFKSLLNQSKSQAIIEIDIKGNLKFENESVNYKELSEKLKNFDWKGNLTVTLVAESGTLFKNVTKTMGICNKYKLRVILATE